MVAVAIRDLVTRRIGPQIPSAVVTLTTAFLVMLGGALWSAVEGLAPMAPQTAATLALAAAFLIAGQLLMVQAVRVAGIAATTPFRYTNVVWALVLGWAIFGFIPDSLAFIGIVLIAGSGLYTILEPTLKQRQRRWFHLGSSQS
jgi:S-adenosylmethionine uptake transporter